MFYVWQFILGITLPVFTEGVTVKHSWMKAILWGKRFLVICLNSRTKFAEINFEETLNPERWLLPLCQLHDSETPGFGPYREPLRYRRI